MNTRISALSFAILGLVAAAGSPCWSKGAPSPPIMLRDVRLIDGAVNGVGETVGGASEVLRRVQTGSVRAYAASLLLGVVLVLGYYLWR